MTIKPSKRSERILDNRIRIGTLWYRIKDQDQLGRFVLSDPDVQAAMEADVDQAIAELRAMALQVIHADPAGLQQIRDELDSDAEFDEFFATCVKISENIK